MRAESAVNYQSLAEETLRRMTAKDAADSDDLATIIRIAIESAVVQVDDLDSMAARVVAMCKKRGWSMHWTHRGAYLHLEASELIEAVRGKGESTPLKEAGDVLLVLMSITEYAGIPFSEVVKVARHKLAWLNEAPPYPGEERSDK